MWIKSAAAFLFTLWVTQAAAAELRLDPALSTVSFVSVKKGEVAEVHYFKNLAGTLDGQGRLNLRVDLSSVETGIPIRNERMQQSLFETGRFPVASLTAQVQPPAEEGVAAVEVQAMLSFHGVERPIPVKAIAHRGGGVLTVAARLPVVIDADEFGLGEGVERLRQVAKLPAIAHQVPVSFVLVFR